MTISAYAAQKAGDMLHPFEYEPDNLGPLDVEIRITNCGICHSDLHLIDDDWHISSYPLVPGHEIVGTITAKGDLVRNLEEGQRVGVGWLRDSCGTCEWCIQGDENLCPDQEGTCVGHHGGFATAIRLNSRFAFPIPEELESEQVGPLMCGGITVYNPLRQHDIRHNMRVGVVGIGGLGHLALQFANAMGCEVTAFSSTPDKEEEARSFGAHHFMPSRGKAALDKVAGSLDFIINTVFADLNWAEYVNVLRPNGKLCFVGVPASPVAVPGMLLLFGQKTITAGAVGGRPALREMLDFAARHGIRAMTEMVPMSEANEAIQKLRDNKARYRMVLKN